MAKTYQEMKEKVRNEAIDWQNEWSDTNYSWAECIELHEYFTIMGKRYGLLREFHENGIC